TSLATGLVEVTGSNVTVNLSSAIAVHVDTFALQTQTVADDSTITLSDASHPSGTLTELTFSLTGASLTLGGVASLSGGQLSLAQVSGASSSYVAAIGTGFALSVNAGPLTFTGSFGFQFNSATPASPAINDWSFTGLPAFAAPTSLAT